MKILITIGMIFGVATLLASANQQPVSQMPTFGSMATGADRLIASQSVFAPSNVLTDPGVLRDRWCSSNEVSELRVRARYDAVAKKKGKRLPPFYEDEFTLSIHSGTNIIKHNFTAAYGPFRVYGVDLGYGGPVVIALETGEGRGTFVHVQRLEILKVVDKRFQTVFAADLNGYVWDPDLHDPVSWERTYSWKHVDGNTFLGLEVQLIQPPVTPRFCGDEKSLFFLQHPRIAFKFNPHRDRFEITEEDFRTLSENGNKDSSNQAPQATTNKLATPDR
jgi:hypothetical protein